MTEVLRKNLEKDTSKQSLGRTSASAREIYSGFGTQEENIDNEKNFFSLMNV